MCFLFTLVTGNCDIFESAPVLLIALQRQFLGSAKYIIVTESLFRFQMEKEVVEKRRESCQVKHSKVKKGVTTPSHVSYIH